ncbi:MAG: TIGR04283 family arsenosugar biosynthesis glycosyltransferase [Xanthomonadales bacterium]|nr:TIGR04283 family arsenosugar biosynthesis glycosyltransferase [Xanthomonadales bacterium]
MNIAIIVPMLNEQAHLAGLLEHLRSLKRQGAEVLLVDGGSQDGSAALAQCAGFTVLSAARGRASQMNTGARATTAEVLLFLHADTCLPANALARIQSSLAGGPAWGHFKVRIKGRSRMLPVVAALMNWRSRLTGIVTGDQAIFILRAAFEAVGGFPEQPLMEDIELSRRLRGFGRPVCIASHAMTSGRRWDTGGVWHTIGLMWWLRLAYWWGTPADQLAQRYR